MRQCTGSRTLSLAALVVPELSPPDMVEVTARIGYSHVDPRLVPATVEERHYSLLADASLRRRILARLRDSGVCTLDVEILRLRLGTHVGEFVAVLEVGAESGACYVLAAGSDDDEWRSMDNFAALCDLVRLFGLDPYLELMLWTGTRDLRQATWVVEAAARDNAGLLLGVLYFDRPASSLGGLWAIPPVRLGYVRLCDVVGPRPTLMDEILRQARGEWRFPGDGGSDLLVLLRALSENLPPSLRVSALDLLVRGVDGAERVRLAIGRTRALFACLQHHRADRLPVYIMEWGSIASKR